MTENRAAHMTMLARVEAAREGRCRIELLKADETLRAAEAGAREAAALHMAVRERRCDALQQDYAALPGQRSALDIHHLRAVEQQLRATIVQAAEGQCQAEAAAREAARLRDAALEALLLASRRGLRRKRLADTLRQAAATAALMAEEEAVEDELADRLMTRGAA